MPSKLAYFRSSAGLPLGADAMLRRIAAGRRCQRLVQSLLQPLQLSEAQLLLLWQLGAEQQKQHGQVELAERLGLSPPHVSGLVEQLRSSGYVVSLRDPADRRRQLWQLTPAGDGVLRQALDALERSAGPAVEAVAQPLRVVPLEATDRPAEGDAA